jgi:hypothetical protein
MKTSIKVFTGIAVAAILLTSAQVVFADSSDYYEQTLVQEQGRGQGQGRGANPEQDGLMEDYMTIAMADVFGLSVEELELRLEAEESFITIALSQGFTIEEVDGLMDEIRSTATEIAATEGTILGRQEANQMVNQLGTKGQGGRIAGGDEAPRINMSEGECDETCDADGIPLYENATGESMMRRRNR